MKFLGIDLGWSSRPSGLCCLEWTDQQLQLIDLDRIEAIADILTWIDTRVNLDEPATIAVDAPTLIPFAPSLLESSDRRKPPLRLSAAPLRFVSSQNTPHQRRPQSSRRSTRQPNLCLCSGTLVVLGLTA